MPNGRCKLHGGASLSGSIHPNWKHGRYDKSLPKALSRFHDPADPDRVSNLAEIDAITAHIRKLYAELDEGDSPATRRQCKTISRDLDTALEKFHQARRQGNGVEMSLALQRWTQLLDELRDVTTHGVSFDKAMSAITGQILVRKKLVDSQIRVQQHLSTEQANSMSRFLFGAVVRALEPLKGKVPLELLVQVMDSIERDAQLLLEAGPVLDAKVVGDA